MAFLEIIALTGCKGRIVSLGLDPNLCRLAAEARDILDVYDGATGEDEASKVLQDFVAEHAFNAIKGGTHPVSVALRLGRSWSDLESAVFAWWVLIESRFHADAELPPHLDQAQLLALLGRESKLGDGDAFAGDDWDREYRSRHPDVDPDATASEIWAIVEMTEMLGHIKVESKIRDLLAWAQPGALEIGIEMSDLASAFPLAQAE